jgi:DNA invertase Pin-like site-specific DNA recombinase
MNYKMFVDYGISGAKEIRPALNQMMDRVDKGECSQIIPPHGLQ